MLPPRGAARSTPLPSPRPSSVPAAAREATERDQSDQGNDDAQNQAPEDRDHDPDDDKNPPDADSGVHSLVSPSARCQESKYPEGQRRQTPERVAAGRVASRELGRQHAMLDAVYEVAKEATKSKRHDGEAVNMARYVLRTRRVGKRALRASSGARACHRSTRRLGRAAHGA